ncbi:MAG TPA: toll/interleukin-1 receptor domain-containing protein [Planctomycetaceae bacterium]|jgi:hypothetical protein|nr:toll/interleukin-1 receptor domain-containing protein [Planctomycetaceae bacterium]
MSEGRRDYHHLNPAAANELETQSQKARVKLERLAARLAATKQFSGRPSDPDLVLPKHVSRAAKILFRIPSSALQYAVLAQPIFLSCSRNDDEPFIEELTEKLKGDHLAYFDSKLIPTGARFASAICGAIQGCNVFVSVVTPRFLESHWFTTEAGAALGANKRMFLALRHVKDTQLPSPFNQFQIRRVDSNRQVNAFIAELRRSIRPKRLR